jgi:PPP family 3-phenylpropionic acid transporter
MPSRIAGLRISIFYAFLSLGMGVQLPFLPLWLGDRGLQAAEIGIVFAAMTASRIVASPLVAGIADRHGNRRAIIILCCFLSFASYLGLALASSFWPILAISIVAGATFAPVFPLGEGFGIDGSKEYGLDYGRLRLWASISFLAGSLLAGAALQVVPTWTVIFMIAAAQGALALVTLSLPNDVPRRQPAPSSPGAAGLPGLFAASGFVIFLIATSLGQASHGLINTLGSVQWHDRGFNEFTIGCFWAAAVLAEVLLFAFSQRAVARLGAANLIVIGVAGGLLRWLVLALTPGMLLTGLAQTLHAASFAMVHLGTMHFIQANVPETMRNTAQGVHAALAGGVFMAATMWMSGPLYDNLGSLAFLAMAAISLVALGFALMLVKISPRAPALADT